MENVLSSIRMSRIITNCILSLWNSPTTGVYLPIKVTQAVPNFHVRFVPSRSVRIRAYRQQKSDPIAKFSSDRIAVENIFGRACGLWSVLERKWRWSEDKYNKFFRICLSLTNIRWHLLRRGDLDRFHRMTIRTYEIGAAQAERCRSTLERYRQKCRRRIDMKFRAQGHPDTEDDIST